MSIRVNINLRNHEKLMGQLIRSIEAADESVAEWADWLAWRTKDIAVDLLNSPPASGRIYTRYNPIRMHQASAPGEPPMSDTGRLARRIRVVKSGNKRKPRASVGTELPYGQMLEFGTTRMAARPWLLPAFRTARFEADDVLKRTFEGKT